MFRRGRIADDFVYDFERQPGEEIRDYDTRFNILLRRFEAVAESSDLGTRVLEEGQFVHEKQSQIVRAAMSRYEYEPLRDAMLALREGGVPLHRKQSGAYSAQLVEAQDEEDEVHVPEADEASDDEFRS